ncbi:MAG: AsmA-like C-terminal region-containing protein, partial [Pirellulaceae bacterium]|nr:AsmA-like C-terminal region-containing protein [Pirellulaceae bacterium]
RLPLASLPAAVGTVFTQYAPRGTVDLAGRLEFDGTRWRPEISLRCRDLSVQYEKFPYRLNGGTGTIDFRQDLLTLRLRLLAGSQTVQCRAEVRQPGPNFTGWVEVQSEGPLAIDERMIAALDPKAQKIIRAFRPRGSFSFQSLLQRGAGEAAPRKKLLLTLHDCSVQHERFPYPIDKVNGSLQLTDRDWLFRNLTGRNDSAYITGEGSWIDQPADGNQLVLRFTASDVPLADELRAALSPGAQRLWANLRPRGNIDNLVVGMRYSIERKQFAVDVQGEKWPPGQNVEGRAISIEPTWFRYRLDNLIGGIKYQNGTIELSGLEAVHGNAGISAAGVVQVTGDGGCRMQLSRLSADRLEIDNDLLAALPPAMGQGLSRLGLSGPINMHGGLGITVHGQPGTSPELDWDLTFDLENGRLATKTPVEHIHGGVRLVGHSGPQGMASRGEVAIDSAIIRDVQFLRISGPVLLDPQRLLFGAPAERGVPGRAPRQMTAGVFGGLLAFGGELGLSDPAGFTVQSTLEGGDLATIVRETAPTRRGLSGKVNAAVNLGGTTEGVHTWRGNGQIRLRDADIYELPVMISMLKLLAVRQPDKTAFTTSDIDFRIEGDDLAFDRIDFSGDAISLKGKGRMNGQREIDLKFHPQVGRDEFHLPIFRPLVGEASRQFMLIEVTGTLDQPQMQRQVFPQLDERLQDLFPELAREPKRNDPAPPVISIPRDALRRAGLLPN